MGRDGLLLLLLLAGCSRAGAPCPVDAGPRTSVVLIVTIMTPNAAPASYQREFASLPACEAAKRDLQAQMDGAIVRARNAMLNERPPEQGWSGYRGGFRPIQSGGEQAYPDLVAVCAVDGVRSAETGQKGLPALPDGTDVVHDLLESPGPAAVAAPSPAPPTAPHR